MEENKKRMKFEERVKKTEKYKKIKELFHINKLSGCIKNATQYLEKYGDNVQVLFMRAVCYRKLEKYEKEIEDLNSILKLEAFNTYALIELCYLYFYLNRYEEAKNILNILLDDKIISPNDIPLDYFIKMKKKLDQLGCDTVFIKEKTIYHINDRHIQMDTEDDLFDNQTNKTSYFYDDIDINYLYDTVKEVICSSKKANVNSSYEEYFFGVPNIGFCEEELINFIKVVVVPGTSNIITIYPTNEIDCKNYDFLKIDYNLLHGGNQKSYKA